MHRAHLLPLTAAGEPQPPPATVLPRSLSPRNRASRQRRFLLHRHQQWPTEECFQQAKGEAGLDHYQVRSWRAWYAHITLSMLALAWLAASRAQARKKGAGTSDPGMIGYTLPEIRRLLNSLIQRYAPDPERRLVLVPLAPATPVPGPALPLPAPRLRTHLSLQLHFARDPARG